MSSPPENINYTLSSSEIDQLRPYGEVHYHAAGDLLIEEGERHTDCLVTLSGQIDIHIATPDGLRRVGWMETGQFPGEISVLTGQAVIARTTMGIEGEVLHIPAAKPKAIVDPTGCGDAYRAGLLYGLMNDMEWETIGRIASLMGAIKVESYGTQNHTFDAQGFDERFKKEFDYALDV